MEPFLVPVENQKEDVARTIARYLRYSHVGLQFLLSIVLPTGLGIWLDGRLGTKALFTILGLALGFAAGLYWIYGQLFGGRKGGPRGGDGGSSPPRASGGGSGG